MQVGDRITDPKLGPGVVVAKVNDTLIVYLDQGGKGWLLPSTWWDHIDAHTVRHLDLLAERYYLISDFVSAPHGLLHCVNCNNPNPHAEPNLPNGRYQCFECRTS